MEGLGHRASNAPSLQDDVNCAPDQDRWATAPLVFRAGQRALGNSLAAKRANATWHGRSRCLRRTSKPGAAVLRRASETNVRDGTEPTFDFGVESRRLPTKTSSSKSDMHSFLFQDDSDGAVAAAGRTPCADSEPSKIRGGALPLDQCSECASSGA